MKEEIQDLISNAQPKDKPIIFRANKQDRILLDNLCERLNLKQSAIIRVAIRSLDKETRGKK